MRCVLEVEPEKSAENRRKVDLVTPEGHDAEKCYLYWCENGTDCSTCVSVCPYNPGLAEASSDEFWTR